MVKSSIDSPVYQFANNADTGVKKQASIGWW